VAIDGLLRESETMNLISASKVGKSWGVLDLALSKATGGKWLGAFACAQGRVLLIDNELHPETLADRIRKVADARGINPATVHEAVQVVCLRGRLHDLSELRKLFDRWGIRPGDYSLTIMDALYRLVPPGTEENSNAGMARLYGWVDELAEGFKTAIALVHHSSKGDQSQKSVTDVGAGAGSISRATDTHVILRPHDDESAVVMDVALRSFAPVPSRCFRWEFPTWNPADDLNPELLSSPGKKKLDQHAEARDRKCGHDLLEELGKVDPRHDGYGQTKLRKALGWNPDKFNRVLRTLIASGILEECAVIVARGNGATTDASGLRRRTRG